MDTLGEGNRGEAALVWDVRLQPSRWGGPAAACRGCGVTDLPPKHGVLCQAADVLFAISAEFLNETSLLP